ncbi:hypothetical protein Y032_0225g2747 [Ancylostoma ceylanicum]|uniref:Uncharacterized protein n=1 Tax=Ancylostoma ceylanicum TaxID=53326 RepID=A0A016SGV4_9BILA|nr:hypothetical protein Y032_0225g2747 [Ancylostoma ceylanicum]
MSTPVTGYAKKRKPSSPLTAKLTTSKYMVDDAINILDQIHNILSTKAPEALPLLEKFVSKFPSLSSEIVEAEKRPRSVVIYGVPEADSKLSATSRQAHTEAFVSGTLDALDVETRPVEVFRMG